MNLKIKIITFAFICCLQVNHHSGLLAQEVNLDKFINDSTFTDVANLNASLNSGLNSAAIQVINTHGLFQVNLSLNSVWVRIAEDQRAGPLSNTGGFQVPFAQVEIGLPFRINMLGRAMSFNIGEEQKERAFLWGVGMRYTMLEETPNARAGIVIMYEGLSELEDFDIKTLLIQGYFGYHLSRMDIYIAPGASRSIFNLHLNGSNTNEPVYEDSKIETFLKFSGGIHYYLSRRLALTGNIIFGDYMAIGFGGNITLF